MTRSILGLLIIAGCIALVGDILANLARIEELRSLKRQLAKFERAFRKDQRVRARREKNEERVELIVKDETDSPLKFGDE